VKDYQKSKPWKRFVGRFGNLLYWLDFKSERPDLFIGSILPFMDKDALHLFDEWKEQFVDMSLRKKIGSFCQGQGTNRLGKDWLGKPSPNTRPSR